jgi:hypothetical protein
MIVSTILDLPKVIPDDWEKWWSIWNTHSRELHKVGKSPNSESGVHVGFDVFKTSKFKPAYAAEFCDLKSLYPSLFESVMALPIDKLGVRFVMSRGDFPAHMDNKWPNWSIRNMFFCDDPNPQWYYVSGEKKMWLTLPEESNWWAYKDGTVKHGTIYREQYPKIIIQYFTLAYTAAKYVESQFDLFPSFNIHD